MQENLTKILEENLRDIHLPEPVSWWPLAIGWWAIIIVLILALSLLVFKLRQRKRLNQYRKTATIELEQQYANWGKDQNTVQYLRSANSILKRCVIHQAKTTQSMANSNQPITGVAGAIGSSWSTLLSCSSPSPLSPTSLEALTINCYQPEPKVDISNLHNELLIWLRTHEIDLRDFKFYEGEHNAKEQEAKRVSQHAQITEPVNA